MATSIDIDKLAQTLQTTAQVDNFLARNALEAAQIQDLAWAKAFRGMRHSPNDMLIFHNLLHSHSDIHWRPTSAVLIETAMAGDVRMGEILHNLQPDCFNIVDGEWKILFMLTQFHAAIYRGHLEYVRYMITHGGHAQAASNSVRSIYTLLEAAIGGSQTSESVALERVEFLVDEAKVEAQDAKAVRTAAAAGFGKIVAYLIERGASANERIDQYSTETALTEAVRHCKASVVELLLRSGADPSFRSNNNDQARNGTALELAEMKGRRKSSAMIRKYLEKAD